jgi:hypothetical protein
MGNASSYVVVIADESLFLRRRGLQVDRVFLKLLDGSDFHCSREEFEQNSWLDQGVLAGRCRDGMWGGVPYATLSEFCSLDSHSSLYCPSYITIDLQMSLDHSHCNLSKVDQINGKKEGPCNFSLSRRSNISSHD